ncbi:hypothetical protein KR51_00023170 [Rubidibacter lacunae KORDI 51-2]|uniref:Uncharacterized protein n=1 Tax=Rubidibacter lacunae KORDI 51-2 TaxID=582515 RepID=U5DMZ0_9CHRO|nr:hypothetical protein KR51_00023170 [Rubidibacter lacunae KORDI 51-2]
MRIAIRTGQRAAIGRKAFRACLLRSRAYPLLSVAIFCELINFGSRVAAFLCFLLLAANESQCGGKSAETTADVILSRLLLWVFEDLSRAIELH